MFGGGDGLAPNVIVERPEENVLELLKANGVKVRAGTVIRSRTGGGGGYGKAFERDPEAVLRDVIDGYVSREHARQAYGVAITSEPGIDADETRRLRSA